MVLSDSYLARSVQAGDVFKVRGAIIGIIRAEPGRSRADVNEALEYTQKHSVDVFETENDDERSIIDDPAKWDLGYYAEALAYLQMNFTKERLEHVLLVSEKIHPAPAAQTAVQPHLVHTDPSQSGGPSKKPQSRLIKAAIAIGIAATLIIILIIILATR